MSEARYLIGDVFDRLADIADGSIDLIVTSPPFLALRSYLPSDHPDKGKEIGSEATPAAFLSTLLALTREWRRVLAPHGSLCVELGDTYSGSERGAEVAVWNGPHHGSGFATLAMQKRDRSRGWPLDKSLCLLPTLYPASLAYGRNLLTGEPCEPWRIRNQIVWHRPNPPVGALGDKVRPSTSYVTVACTSRTRWFDLDAERGAPSPNTHARTAAGVTSRPNDCKTSPDGNRASPDIVGESAGAPPLDCWLDTTTDDVWTLSTQGFKGAHYATFPITLPRKLINLMCPRQVCTVCGEPRRRIVETTQEVITYGHYSNRNSPGQRSEAKTESYKGRRQDDGDVKEKPSHHQGFVRHAETLGWSDCGHNTWRRGIVCDPFAGSGTTLVAASELGRDSIGIDIDARNLDLARQRCGMFLIEDETAGVAL